MPNFSAEERRALSGEELELATQSRQPQLGALDDAALAGLIARLRAARDKARGRGNRQAREARGKADPAGVHPAGGNEGTVEKEKFLTAALRRATIEQKRRQAVAAQAAGKAASAAQQAAPAAPEAKPADPAAPAAAAAPKKPGTSRTPATRGNTAARGARAKAAAQPTDRRGSGARKVAKPKPAPVVTATEPPAANTLVAEVAAAPVTKPAQRTTPVDAAPADSAPATTALVKDLTEKAARRAAKAEKARTKAEKAARQADKLGDKKSKKALKKAEDKAQKAHRKARKTVRQARKAAADLT